MKISINSIDIPSTDHLSLAYFPITEFERNKACHFCDTDFVPVIKVTNKFGQSGLETGLCSGCGAVSKNNSLSATKFSEHFQKNWLLEHSSKIKLDPMVYEKVQGFISPKNPKVLDIGCGNGSYLSAFVEAGYECFGVEPSVHRSNEAKSALKNIHNMEGEAFLKDTNEFFDLIYLHDVLQFTENPLDMISLAVSQLNPNGKIWWKLGVFYKRSNIIQFGHFSVLRNYFNLYSLLPHLQKLGLRVVTYKERPFEILLDKTDRTGFTNPSAKKWSLKDIEKFSKDSIKYYRSKYLGPQNISYLNRNFNISLVADSKPFTHIEMNHDSEELPVLFK